MTLIGGGGTALETRGSNQELVDRMCLSWAVLVFWVINRAWNICSSFKERELTEILAFAQEGWRRGIRFMFVASIGPQPLEPAPPETRIYLYIILFLQRILFPFRIYLLYNSLQSLAEIILCN